jgi:hypothetical protein
MPKANCACGCGRPIPCELAWNGNIRKYFNKVHRRLAHRKRQNAAKKETLQRQAAWEEIAR